MITLEESLALIRSKQEKAQQELAAREQPPTDWMQLVGLFPIDFIEEVEKNINETFKPDQQSVKP